MQHSKCQIQLGKHSKKDHQCTVNTEGNWLVFRCPICSDYERRIHTKTGEMKTKGGTQGSSIKHYGSYIRPGLDANLYSPN